MSGSRTGARSPGHAVSAVTNGASTRGSHARAVGHSVHLSSELAAEAPQDGVRQALVRPNAHRARSR